MAEFSLTPLVRSDLQIVSVSVARLASNSDFINHIMIRDFSKYDIKDSDTEGDKAMKIATKKQLWISLMRTQR